MADPRESANSLYLAGEVHALVTFAQVLAMTHPDPRRLARHFQGAEQAGLASAETMLAGDALVNGYQFAADQIRRAIEAAQETPSIDDRE